MIGWLKNTLLGLSRPAKRLMAVVLDILLCTLAVYVAFYLRLDEWAILRGVQWFAVALSVVIAIPVFIVSGLYRAIFRYSEAAALTRIAQASLVYGVAYFAIITIYQVDYIPRTIGIIQPVLLFLFIASSRVLAGWLLGGSYATLLQGSERHTVMIYGAGFAGRQLYKALGASEMKVVGFIDDDRAIHGQVLFGKPVFAADDIGGLVQRFGLTDILLAIPSATRRKRHEIVDLIRHHPVRVRTVPGLSDVAKGRVKMTDLRELEIQDLLGRDAVVPDDALLGRNIAGKVVLVTGAGGSIGSELCRQIVAQSPATLLLVEISESSLYPIHRELEALASRMARSPTIIPLLASVCDGGRIGQVIAAWRPDTIYHAAAYKHVPLVEQNPIEGIRNNVLGTLTLGQAALACGVANFVFVSTDKAVRPTNIMGASKRLAEQVLQALARDAVGTCFSMVRFGNVLGSSGSVVPLFRQQIQAGGPLTITHPDITRYFMTIPEAAELVIQAGAMAAGGEVFVLDMGEPIRIVDLARLMVQSSGLSVRDGEHPDGEIEFEFVGLRPGEKLYEELLIGNDPVPTDHVRIMKASEHFLPWEQLTIRLTQIEKAVVAGHTAAVVDILRDLVPEYTPEKFLVDWVYNRERAMAHDATD